MTEAEIMKALECCKTDNCGKHCPFYEYADCMDRLDNLLLDLINRKNAENEKLSMEIDELIIAKDQLFDEAEALIKKARAETIKEFGERLMQMCDEPNWCVWLSDIDQIAKEMGVEL